MERNYFISYSWSNKNQSGFGHCVLSFNRKIKNLKDIDEITKNLKDSTDFESCVIINFIKL